jgi:hypothetical protein
MLGAAIRKDRLSNKLKRPMVLFFLGEEVTQSNLDMF